MKIRRVSLTNFRCFSELTLDLNEESVYLVGSNAVGKTTILEAIQRALRGGSVSAQDFNALDVPLEIVVTLTGIAASDQSRFAEAIDFSETPPVLRVGYQSVWSEEELEPESTHGFPDDGWKRISRPAREALPFLMLPTWRDPARLTAVVGRSSLLADLLADLPLEGELEQAVQDVAAVGEALAAATPIEQLLADASAEINRYMSSDGGSTFSLKNAGSSPQDALRQLELYLEADGTNTALSRQSAGLSQAAIFALVLRQLSAGPGTVILVDEPELALHPQAQRALASTLRSSASQCIVVTHSAAVLDRVDPRKVARINREGGAGTAIKASTLSDSDAQSLSRYATSHTAEAFFARSLIVVEGFSDLLAIRTLASKLGLSLDASGVSVLSLDGAGTFKYYLQLFGPQGLDVQLRGLCDQDAESDWIVKLDAAGISVGNRSDLEAQGFYVCDPDLEAELLSALGTSTTQQIIIANEAEGSYSSFANQQVNQGKSEAEIQLAFFRREKVRWAPLFSAEIDGASVPSPIAELLGEL